MHQDRNQNELGSAIESLTSIGIVTMSQSIRQLISGSVSCKKARMIHSVIDAKKA
jgi:hypothetical protein